MTMRPWFCARMRFHTVDTVDEVLDVALEPDVVVLAA